MTQRRGSQHGYDGLLVRRCQEATDWKSVVLFVVLFVAPTEATRAEASRC
jgi:hypothetical protein